jgi:hypothetical protein
MIRKSIVLGMLVGACCWCFTAISADSDYLPIQYIKIQGNGTYVKLQGFANSDPSVQCQRHDFFLASTENNYKERTAFLMSAYLADREILITYYDCHGEYIRIGSVQGRR